MKSPVENMVVRPEFKKGGKMRTRLVAVLLVVGVSLVFLAGAEAQSLISERIGVGLRAAYLLPTEDDILDSALSIEGAAQYGVSNNFATEVSVGHTRPDIIGSIEGGGSARITYVNLSFQFRGEPTADFALYLGGGPSVFFNGYKKGQGPDDYRGRDTFGAHLNIGFDYFVTANVVFNMDAKYLFFDYKYINRDNNKLGTVRADSLLMGTGLKYFF